MRSLSNTNTRLSKCTIIYQVAFLNTYLKNVMTKITDLEMLVINIDSTFVGNIPRLEPYKSNMEHKLAEVININSDNISCKATTTDGMGPEGRNEGISAYATVLLEKIK